MCAPLPRAHCDRHATNPGGEDIRSDERRRTPMILVTTQVENVDRFLEVFSTTGATKRAQHGSKGSTVFLDPSDESRVWALFDWDEAGWKSFATDPETPPILHAAGHKGKPQATVLA